MLWRERGARHWGVWAALALCLMGTPTQAADKGAAPEGPISARIVLAGPASDPPPPLPPDFCPSPAASSRSLAPQSAPPLSLPAVRAALRPGGQLEILAIGSGSIFGPPPGRIFDSFVYRMAQALKAAVPEAGITLDLYGGRGIAAETLSRDLAARLAARPAQLVIWQTGTIEALHHVSTAALAQALEEGRAAVLRAGAGLILVDLPYSRILRMHADLRPYEAVLRTEAAGPGVALFPRFELMRGWAEGGGIDLEHSRRAERLLNARRLQVCLGRALAGEILAALPPSPEREHHIGR